MPTPENYTHVQSTPASAWIVNHQLNRFPVVDAVYDSNDEEVGGEVQYLSPTVLHLTFVAAFSGRAILT